MNRFMQHAGQVIVGAILVGVSGMTAQAAWESSPSSGVMSGKIASVDPQRNLLRVKTGLFAGYNFTVKETSKLSNGVREMRLEELKPGDAVSISFDNAAGERVISSLKVTSDSSGGQASQEAQPSGAEAPAQPAPQEPAGEIQ